MAESKRKKKSTNIITAGRPKKYTAKTFKTAVNKYFKSISRTAEAVDRFGRPVYNDDGELIRYVSYAVPPTISALCLFLGIDRSTWQNYADPKQNPDHAPIAEQARARIEAFLEAELVTREKNVNGLIFNLENNFGYRQRRDLVFTAPGAETRIDDLSKSLKEFAEEMESDE